MNHAALADFPVFKTLRKPVMLFAVGFCLAVLSPDYVKPAIARNATNSTVTISVGDALPPPPSRNASKAAPAPEGADATLLPPSTAAAFPDVHWTLLEPGLELGLSILPESRDLNTGAVFAALRIDPGLHHFSLHMASQTGQARSFPDWSRESGLRAGINASMYLPDNVTSTGYMRNGETLNNKKMGSKLGAFFVAGRRNKAVAPADILERESPEWPERLEEYTIVVQNYRLMDSRGKTLWAEGGPLHSIAAVAKDQSGRIVFLLSQEPLMAEQFARRLRELPLSLSTVMYVEGGAQAGLFLHVSGDGAKTLPASFAGATVHAEPDGMTHVWKGRQSLLNTRGNPDALVPNVIGVRATGKDRPCAQ